MKREEPNLYKGDWIVDTEDYGEPSEGHYGWIEVHCPVCGTDFSLEVGQYDWGYGDPFPFLWCPMCGDDKREYNRRMKRNQEEYYRELNEMADEMGKAHDSGWEPMKEATAWMPEPYDGGK